MTAFDTAQSDLDLIRDLLIIKSGTLRGIPDFDTRLAQLEQDGWITGSPYGWVITGRARLLIQDYELVKIARKKGTERS